MGETVWPRVRAVEVLEGRLNRDLGEGLRGGEVFRKAPEMGVQRERC